MKNSIFNAYKSLFIVLISFSVLALAGYSPGHNFKEHGYAFKFDKAVKANVEQAPMFVSVADMPGSTDLKSNISFEYLKPVNDPKPDNTNYQIIRKESLKLHKAIRDC